MPDHHTYEVERSLASIPDLATLIVHTANAAAFRPTTIIYPHINYLSLTSPALRLIPHRLQMLNNRQVPIQKPIHTILRASLLSPFQLSTSNRPGNALLPTDIRQIVNGCATHLLANYLHTFSNIRV